MKEEIFKQHKEIKMPKKEYKNFPNNLKISKDFSDFVPPMAKEDFDLLFQNIKHDGYIRDYLITWNGTILDGHHRYKIAEMLDLDVPSKEMEFESKEKAQYWIAKNQSGQRRMSKAQLAVFALTMLPMFSKIGKQRQSAGGKTPKGKGKKDEAWNSMEEASTTARIGINMVKDLQKIDNDVEANPFVEMIRCGMYPFKKEGKKDRGLTVKEATSLVKRKRRGDFSTLFTEDGKELTPEAESVLNLIRMTPATESEEEDEIQITSRTFKSYNGTREGEVIVSIPRHLTDSAFLLEAEHRCRVSDNYELMSKFYGFVKEGLARLEKDRGEKEIEYGKGENYERALQKL